MLNYDIVVLPRVHCVVAQHAQRVWHSFIKNGFLFHTDDVLARWMRNEADMLEFEVRVRGVCQDINEFSGAGLTGMLTPLSALPESDMKRLVFALDCAFEEGFSPNDMAGRVERKLNILLTRMQEFLSAPGNSDEKSVLDAIREAARNLSCELHGLPDGFWLPRTPPVRTP